MNYEAYDTGETRFIDANMYVNKISVSVLEPYHAHDFIEIVFIESGSGWHVINGEKFSVSSGDIFAVDYDIPHKSIAGENGLVLRNCLFRVSSLDGQYENSRSFRDALLCCGISSGVYQDFSSYLHIQANGDNKYHIINLYDKMLKEYSVKSIGYVSLLRGYITELLVSLARIYEEKDKSKTSVINSVKDYIITNHKENITIDELANHVFLSNQYLCRLFKEQTGMTIIQFLQQVRVEKSINLILSTNKKISDIADLVGYSDLKHFNSVFKKITGTTPSKMRKSHD